MHDGLFTSHERMCAAHVWSFLICKLTVRTAIIRSTCDSTRRSAASIRVVTFLYDLFWHTEVSLSYYMVVTIVLCNFLLIIWNNLLLFFLNNGVGPVVTQILRLVTEAKAFCSLSALTNSVEASEYPEYTPIKALRYIDRPQVIFLTYYTYLR